MRTFEDLGEWRRHRAGLGGAAIGFVPTMGALHDGHRSLLERARGENDRVVASIFVNPTQFDDPADLALYPRDLAADRLVMEGLVDDLLVPRAADIYPDAYRYRVVESDFSRRLEGTHRLGHFDGVLTVVLKLFNLVGPTRAYFGEKDWQQLRLIQAMTQAFFLPVGIVACPTRRDADGLALSSRNRRLSAGGRERAALFPRILRESADAQDAIRALKTAGFEVDYVEEFDGVRLGAVRLEKVRLIDNVRL